jgi:uncharacterized protein YdeI (YjbR/CyaY-like superfamily)
MVASKHSGNWLPAVDVYIHKSAPFAQPILHRIREIVHAAIPDIVEEMKWSMPFFVYRGIILCNMSAFKAHCNFRIWNENVTPLKKEGVAERGAGAGNMGKLTSLESLPAAKDLKKILQQAVARVDSGERVVSMKRAPVTKKPAPVTSEIPSALAAAFKSNALAAQNFQKLSPSAQREYIDWIAEARRDETRDKRIASTLEWAAEGKSRNWKYEKRA